MADRNAKKARILLVDDQKDFLETISFWMEGKGHRVTAAHDGEQAVKIIQEESFDIVFLDIHMPKMDGVETLEQIRKVNKKLPVILLTAYPDEETIEKAKKHGISGYFPKSGPFDSLNSMLEVAMRTHKKLKF